MTTVTTKSKSKPVQVDLTGMNEALMLGLVRQHELTERTDLLNAQLQQEIAARKRTEDALISSEKLASVGRMAAVLAHEINNPLEGITNILYLVQNTDGLPESAREYLRMADGELKRIAHVTRQTLGFYRESTAPATFHLTRLFEAVLDLLQAKTISKRSAIDIKCDEHLEMTAFQGEVRQVVSNLLLNSLDAIPEAGKITMRASACEAFRNEQPAIRITVADNGHGISDSSRRSLFQPFFTTKGTVGNGLGLWVSKQIIEKHGGSIQVRSRTRGPRQGTTFSILLPISRI